jgi:hypothetical protein
MTVLRRLAGCLLLTGLGLLGGCQTIGNARLFLPPSWEGMERIGPDVVVEAAADSRQRAQALAARDQAHGQLAASIGTVRSAPLHYFCHSTACYARFGGGLPRAKSFGESRTLMSPAGLTPAYVAHEWWHAELYARLGLWRALQVPRWFDEGVAVWVSADPRYGEAVYQQVLAQGIAPPRLDELDTFKAFDAAVGRYGDHLKARTPDAITVVYPTVAHEVRRWMQIAGIEGLRALVAGLERGEPFAALYASIEAQAAGRQPRPPSP